MYFIKMCEKCRICNIKKQREYIFGKKNILVVKTLKNFSYIFMKLIENNGRT